MAGFRALIVDDSPTMRQLVKMALRRVPELTDCEEASNGAEALKALKNGLFDIVLLDINMPLMDGLRLLDHIRADPSINTTLVVMLTTEGGREKTQDGLDRGADAYLAKPVKAPHVVSVVSDLLNGREPRSASSS